MENNDKKKIMGIYYNPLNLAYMPLTNDEIKCGFATSFKDILSYTKTTASYLSKKINIPYQTLYRYASGENEPTISQAVKITEYFLFSIDEFVFIGLYNDTEIADCFSAKIIELGIDFATEFLHERFPKLDAREIFKLI